MSSSSHAAASGAPTPPRAMPSRVPAHSTSSTGCLPISDSRWPISFAPTSSRSRSMASRKKHTTNASGTEKRDAAFAGSMTAWSDGSNSKSGEVPAEFAGDGGSGRVMRRCSAAIHPGARAVRCQTGGWWHPRWRTAPASLRNPPEAQVPLGAFPVRECTCQRTSPALGPGPSAPSPLPQGWPDPTQSGSTVTPGRARSGSRARARPMPSRSMTARLTRSTSEIELGSEAR